MPVAIQQDWIEEETERSTRSYDAISACLMDGPPIEGMLIHAAGFTGSGFRIYEVWESQAHFACILADRLMPITLEVSGGDPGAPPTMTVYELHGLVVQGG